MRAKKKTITPLPFGYYCWPVIILAFAGIADSIYLAVSHYRNYVDIGYSSFCAISKAINCDTVSQSSFSIFIGVPVPVWGILGYGVFLAITVFAWRRRKAAMEGWNILFFLSLAFTLYSLVLAFISSYYIDSYCLMCIVSYAINLALLFYTWLIKKRFQLPGLWNGLRQEARCCWQSTAGKVSMGLVVTLVIAAIVFFPDYWHFSIDIPTGSIQTGVTDDGHPWIGATDPELVIIEYTDYLCFQCRKMHYYLRRMVSRYPSKIRLVHRHFPMDNEVNPIVKEPFHVGSGRLAVLSLYAAEKGKFWEMNDLLFQAAGRSGEIDLQELADHVGLKKEELSGALANRVDLRQALMKDIYSGLGLKIPGTPAYIVGDNVYLGMLRPELFDAIIR